MKELKNEKNNEGFTFVETTIVLSIMAVLAAGSAVSGGKLIAKSKRISARNQIEQFAAGLQSYYLDCGCFPTSEQGLGALWFKPDMFPIPEKWNGPYIDKEPAKDPWGSDYRYYCGESPFKSGTIPETLPYVLYSCGSDGEEGGEGEAEDVVSWK